MMYTPREKSSGAGKRPAVSVHRHCHEHGLTFTFTFTLFLVALLYVLIPSVGRDERSCTHFQLIHGEGLLVEGPELVDLNGQGEDASAVAAIAKERGVARCGSRGCKVDAVSKSCANIPQVGAQQLLA
jgi:hypothetical protein